MDFKLIGEIVGVIAIIESFFIYLSNRRKSIILMKGVSDVLWCINGFMVGAFTGAVLNIVMIFREFVFYNRVDKKWAQHKFWMYFFCAMCFASPIIELINTGHFNLFPFFPAVGSVFAVFGFYDTNPKRIRVFNFIASVPWFIYSSCMGNITGASSNIIAMASVILGTVLAKRKDK